MKLFNVFKKTIILIALGFICAGDVTAQEMYFGPKVGLNVSTILGEAAKGTFTDYSNDLRTGFCLGGLFEYKIRSDFGLAAEILYSQQGFEYEV
jgi:hypothetical protein